MRVASVVLAAMTSLWGSTTWAQAPPESTPTEVAPSETVQAEATQAEVVASPETTPPQPNVTVEDQPAPDPSAPTAKPPAGDGNTPAKPVAKPKSVIPPPSSVRNVPERITVAVGLSPEAPGSKEERSKLNSLERSARNSIDPQTHVRRLRPGAGEPRRICRERRDDLVIMIGYLPKRPLPVVLAHDCRLDAGLGVRAIDAIHEPGLVGALWNEHQELLRQGMRERRRLSLSPRVRGGIIAGVAVVVVGVAVGVLVANALRDEKVVITVGP